MQAERFRIAYYTDESGRKPFREWLHGLRDQIAAIRIRARLTRVRAGNFGSVRNVGEGVVELKIDHGPGSGDTILISESKWCSQIIPNWKA